MNHLTLLLRDTIRERVQQLKALDEERKALIEQLQDICGHELVAEVEYDSVMFGSSLPPRRICEICGFEEEGWGCGYQNLRRDRVRMLSSRDEFYKLRTLDFDLEL